ncbi:MAG: isoprenylcysteine carboxylmethyltransferase family protein [Dehalococcoidia bacterium]
MSAIRTAACVTMALARLAELRLSRRNLRHRGKPVEGRRTRATYPLIVLLHTVVIAGTLLRGSVRPRLPWLLALLAVQPLRAWVLILLGDRWNTRAAVPPAMTVETGGPYRFVRHPNYAVVIVELLALPMAFRLPWLAAGATIANAALLAVRIPEEEAALMDLPGYRAHFEARARFLPGIF